MRASETQRSPLLSAFAAGLLTLGVFQATALYAAPPVRVSATDFALESAARGVAKGERLIVEGLLLDRTRSTSVLELERFEVWRPDAVVMIDGKRVPAPRTVYFKGTIDGDSASKVLLSVREKGGATGMVFKSDGAWAIGKGRGQGALRSRKGDPAALAKPFECGLDDLPAAQRQIDFTADSALAASSSINDKPYDATIAIETDAEYLGLFGGNQTAALDYMGDLIGYSDLTYSREIDTDMLIGFSRLWTGGTASDPWTIGACGNPAVEPCGTDDALYQFRSYWNANMSSTKRTVAHMFSGKGLGGGIAWIGVLCNNYGSPGSSYDYGLSASLGGSFNWDGDQSHDPASVVWDIMVTQHEIGHNFNSPHTQDYCNVGGSPDPIDRCYSGCAGAATGLPSCTADPITAYHSGSGKGTIMSYCHLVSGSYGNQAMTFGEGHPCGTLPGRQADRMSAFVVSRAGSYPSCFVSSTCGNGAIDAGEQCDSGNLNGASCSSLGFVSGPLSCSSSCTFDTSQCQSCGNNLIDAGEVCDGTALAGASCGSLGCTGGGTLSCNGTCTGFDKTFCSGCPQCDNDGLCDAGEECLGCPSDCASGATNGAVCGNNICEAGNGEDCLNCPSDCRGVQGGKPSGRYCCGDGSGSNPIACTDSRCTQSGKSCTTVANPGGSFCCGDDSCSSGESCTTCSLDCALGAEVCGNGTDDNCNGQADCADSACALEPACLCQPTGQSCSSSSQCCSNNCRTKGKNAGTCA